MADGRKGHFELRPSLAASLGAALRHAPSRRNRQERLVVIQDGGGSDDGAQLHVLGVAEHQLEPIVVLHDQIACHLDEDALLHFPRREGQLAVDGLVVVAGLGGHVAGGVGHVDGARAGRGQLGHEGHRQDAVVALVLGDGGHRQRREVVVQNGACGDERRARVAVHAVRAIPAEARQQHFEGLVRFALQIANYRDPYRLRQLARFDHDQALGGVVVLAGLGRAVAGLVPRPYRRRGGFRQVDDEAHMGMAFVRFPMPGVVQPQHAAVVVGDDGQDVHPLPGAGHRHERQPEGLVHLRHAIAAHHHANGAVRLARR